MKLKRHLLGQNLKILITTVLITVCLSLLFARILFYRQTARQSTACQTAVMIGSEVIFAGPNITEFDVRSVLLELSAGKTETLLEGLGQLSISREQYAGHNGVLYTVVKLTPVLELDVIYRRLLLFVVSVFFITFLVAVVIAEQHNERGIIHPLGQLKQAAERLTEGDVTVPMPACGIGEVEELAEAMERLRLKLCDSVQHSRQLEEERTFLLSSISHDLKTPVTAVRGYIEGVLDGVADSPEKKRTYLVKAVDKLGMLTTMIDDLLLYSRLDSGRVPFSFSYVSVLGFMQQQIDDFLPLFAAEGRSLILVNELRTAATLRLDGERFQRVIQNIFNNAIRHTAPQTGAVTVFLRETEVCVVIEIHDNGDGIAPEDLPHIFERFYRADSARTVDGGSGLGLAIARQLVTGMGGRIWALSPPGEGCSILISMKKYQKDL